MNNTMLAKLVEGCYKVIDEIGNLIVNIQFSVGPPYWMRDIWPVMRRNPAKVESVKTKQQISLPKKFYLAEQF